MLAASLVCATLSRVSVYISASDLGWYFGVGLSVTWVVLLLIAVWQYRWRGLWLLIGAPLAFWLPCAMYLMAQACSHNRLACL
jgi:hypothetical protein